MSVTQFLYESSLQELSHQGLIIKQQREINGKILKEFVVIIGMYLVQGTVNRFLIILARGARRKGGISSKKMYQKTART